MKSSLPLFRLAIFSLALLGSGAWAQNACTTSGGAITNNSDYCNTQSDNYTVTLYRVGICTSQPTAPTTDAAAGLSSCATVYDNPAGSEVTIVGSVASALAGAFTRPPNAVYTHVYAAIAPQVKVKAQMTFNTSRTGAVGGAGTKCWTREATHYFKAAAGPVGTSNCGDAVSGQGIVTSIVNTLADNVSGPVGYSTSITVAGAGVTMYLTKSDYTLGTLADNDSLGTIGRLLVITNLGAQTITDATTGVELSFNTSEGAGPEFGAGGAVSVITAGPIRPRFSIR